EQAHRLAVEVLAAASVPGRGFFVATPCEVRAGAERSAVRAEEDRTHLGLAVGVLQGARNAVDEGDVQVVVRGTLDLDRGDVPVDGEPDVLELWQRHRSPSSGPSPKGGTASWCTSVVHR